MATIQFRVRSKANKNVSIKVRLSIDRNNVFELNTGFAIHPKDWSEATGLPKQNNPENKLLSSDLKKLDSFITNNLNTDLGKSILIDSNWLESKINDCFSRVIKTDTGLLVNHIQFIIDNANTRKVKNKIGLSPSTIKNYTLFRNIILEYQKKIKKQILFIEITKPFVDKFTNWLINTKNYSTNYAGKQLEILKTVCIDAEKNEIQVTPYSKIIPFFRESDKDRYIQTLSFDELELIKNVDLSNIEQLNKFKKENPELTKNLSITPESLSNVRNWILLGCEIGQRGGDLLEITNENIRYNGKNYYIDIVQQKTNKSVTIGIIAPHVIDIIENNLPKKIPHQKLNEYAKVICKLAGIIEVVKGTKLNIETNRKELGNYPKYELIASHCFRRSFASNYYKKIPTPILINITGHSKESLFLTYINKREDKDANADLFMQFYEKINKDKEPQLKVIKNGTND
ncbi:phage integrase SAM-like domain-containing protein [Flavobacterium sp. NG2]|uniref:phage integrase SAM-like domain-containing protein n=1 Tax=Flavobacterium sp. NG2 TaxID=3097547 RepID=UPI002A833846|nr:phage integrase SAM-like domain-containing protein [Flavobacterium sp. NG2]WPR72494.1 phage integrase SAM-like domain-containing protein [Flavobacterium sp. NG2]